MGQGHILLCYRVSPRPAGDTGNCLETTVFLSDTHFGSSFSWLSCFSYGKWSIALCPLNFRLHVDIFFAFYRHLSSQITGISSKHSLGSHWKAKGTECAHDAHLWSTRKAGPVDVGCNTSYLKRLRLEMTNSTNRAIQRRPPFREEPVGHHSITWW